MAQLQHITAADEVQYVLLGIAFSFLFSVPYKLWMLSNSAPKTIPSLFGTTKAVLSLLLPILQVGHLFQNDGWPGAPGFINAAQSVVFILAAFAYCVLSPMEHKRSIQPSTPIILFLVGNLTCAVPRWILLLHDNVINRSFTNVAFDTLVNLTLLVVESHSKKGILLAPYTVRSPEDTAGVLSRTFFWWINPILVEGYWNILRVSNLPSLDSKLLSVTLREAALLNWGSRVKPENSMTLPRALLYTLRRPFIGAFLPQLCFIVFKYSQPLLIREAVRFLSMSKIEEKSADGFNIVAAAVVIYAGLAISNAAYQRAANRLRVMTRGVLISLVHHKTLNTGSDVLNEGTVVTLMSNDVDNLSDITNMLHGVWSQVMQVIIGIVLLASEVGWLWPLPLVFIFFCSRVSRFVAQNLRNRQGAWNLATQDRISMTSTVLSAIKGIKMLGLKDGVSTYIEKLRHEEILKARRVRWMMFAYNASANALGMFTPVITLVLYAAIARWNGYALDTETAFTTMAILGMVTHPANMVMTIVPRAIAAFSNFERIQNFLLEQDLADTRAENIPLMPDESTEGRQRGIAISVRGLSVQGTSSKPLLRNITFEVAQGSLCICAGPTASGKTVLIKVLLGEISAYHGSVSVGSKRIGYCAQETWLPNTTLKQAVTSFSRSPAIDETWYSEVLRLCCLHTDLKNMASGDETAIGSRGMNLSGGQRQRVALARAVFARPPILILDDILSGLDGKTGNQIVENLFGSAGVLRHSGTTVFFISNSAHHFHLADHILILENAGIKEQGSWNQLEKKQRQIGKTFSQTQKRTTAEPEQVLSIPRPRKEDKSLVHIDSDRLRSGGDNALYGYYIKSAGYGNFTMMVTCIAICSIFVVFPQYWLKLWTDSDSSANRFFSLGFVFIALTAWVSTNGIMWSTNLRVAQHSGLKLHSVLLDTILGAPLSYFSKTETGQILNRFSQDIQLVDKQLASAMSALFVQIFKLTTQLVLLFLASRYMTITLPFCCIAVYIIQKVYLRTSRQLRLLELESRSAVFSSFLETIEGVSTIRAFQASSQAEVDHLQHLDTSQKPYYVMLYLQQWLSLVLDLLIAAVASGVTILAVVLRGTTTGGEIGLALNVVILANATLLSLVKSWTNLEVSLGAISRLKTLEESVTPEDQEADTAEAYLSRPWPQPGAIEMQGVTAEYSAKAVAFHEFSLRAEPGQLTVLSGRTGRGKSSVLLSLLKMINVTGGSITVHGLNIMHAPSRVVREKFFVTVPQDAIFFNQASLRFNVDAYETLGDDTIVAALKKTGLLRHFQITADDDDLTIPKMMHDSAVGLILDKSLIELPRLSAGQTQLLALARALLQVHSATESGYKPIILLDEATSSLDTNTEELMLSVVYQEFIAQGFTVLMVAHRLHAVKSIMREGVDRIVEI